MPCNCDHLHADQYEIEAAKVFALLEELQTGKLPNYFGDGYCKHVYSKTTKTILDTITEKLCTALKGIDNVKNYSPEMQIWWRDHQKADEEKVAKEKSIMNDVVIWETDTPEEKIKKLWRKINQYRGYLKKLDGILEEVGGVAVSCINPYEDIKRAITKLKEEKDFLNTLLEKRAEYFFLDSDQDGHNFVIPSSKKDEWNAWLDLDQNTPEAWEAPEWVHPLNGPQSIEFQNWRETK